MRLSLLTSLLEVLPLGVVLLDARGRVVHFNATEERVARRSRSEVLGRGFFEEIAPCMSQVATLGTTFRDSIGRGPFSSETQFSYRFPFLETPLEVFIRMQSLEVEGEAYAVLFIEDITSRRAVERLRETVSSLLVHDLKNPLAVMMSNLAFLETHKLLKADENALGAAVDSLTAGKRLQRMLLDLLDVSRAESSSLPVRAEPTDVVALLSAVAQEARSLGRQRDISLEVATPTEPLMAPLDAGLMRRALDNLVENAIRYTPAGGKVQLRSRNLEGGRVSLEVQDQGPGIPEAQRERIFEKFGQVEGSQRQQTDLNRGLGLTFVRMAARAHGGDAVVECPPQGGTTFKLVLPRTATRP